MFVCKRCDAEFMQKNSLIKHLNKKKSCNGKEYSIEELLAELSKPKVTNKSFVCNQCNKQFVTQYNLQRHSSICNPKPVVSNNNNSNVNIQSNNGTIINQPLHITINALGQESKSYLNEDLIKNIFLQRFDGLIEAFRQKHLNDEIPENNNLRKNIHKDNMIESYDGEKWNIRTFETVLQDCFKSMGFEIFEFLKENRNINLHDMSEEQRNTVLNSFMHYIGKPLNWQLFTDTDFMKNYTDNYNHIDPQGEYKRRKTIFKLATENVYQYTYQLKKAKECPF